MSVAEEVKVSPAPARQKIPKLDSAGFMARGKQIVVANYNSHRNPEKSPAITEKDVHVVWFTRVRALWKMIVSSSEAHGLLWEITYNAAKDDIYLEVYNRIHRVSASVTGPE